MPNKRYIANVNTEYGRDNNNNNVLLNHALLSNLSSVMPQSSICCDDDISTPICCDDDISTPICCANDISTPIGGNTRVYGDQTAGLNKKTAIKSKLNPNASCFIPAHLTSFTDESVIADQVDDDLCELGDLLTQSMLDTQGDICSDVVLPSEAPSNNTYANSGESPYSILNNLRIKNSSRIILGHLNVNSSRNKFDMVSDLISGKIDIFLISETKIDSTFPTSQFKIPGYSSLYRLDRTTHGGGLLLYVREDIPSKVLFPNFHEKFECITIEFNIFKKKWLLCGTYNPQKSLTLNHLATISMYMDQFAPYYDNIILLGDFNAEVTEDAMAEFCRLFNLKSLIKVPTCYKNLDNPSCIDLILTNRFNSFQNSIAIESGLSDFHKLTGTVLKTIFKKLPPKTVTYRCYKTFSQLDFRFEIEKFLLDSDTANASNDEFVCYFMKVLNKHAPLKCKYIRASEGSFMNKGLRKAIMVRSKLRNRLNNDKTWSANVAYKRQRNLCTSLLRKTKRKYYENLKPSEISDNKKFWKVTKPLNLFLKITFQLLTTMISVYQ